MLNKSIYSKTIVNFFLIIIFSLPFSSCVDWDDGGDWILIRTDIRVHVTVTDFISGNPVPNQLIDWSIHLYSGVTETDNNIRSGQVTTDANGMIDLPVYECMLAAGIVARIIAHTPEQSNDVITPMSVSYDEAVNAANEDDYAAIDVNYPIQK